MMLQSTASLPLVVLLLFGEVPDTTGSDVSYAEVDAGLFDLCGASASYSQTAVWDRLLEPYPDDEVSIRYERLARLAAQRTRYETVEGLPADWAKKRPRVHSTYLKDSVEEEEA